MEEKSYLWLLLYLVISFIWLIVAVFVGFIHRESFFWLGVFIFLTLIYIPVGFYYIRQGQNNKVLLGLYFTVATFMIYLIYQAIRCLIKVTK